MIERGKNRQVLGEIGGASRDRTDDLIVANDNALRLRHRDFKNLAPDYVPLRSENLNRGSPDGSPTVAGKNKTPQTLSSHGTPV